MSVSQRVHVLATEAVQQGLAVSELRKASSALMVATGVRDVTPAEWRQVKDRLEYVSARQSGSSDRCPSCGAVVFWGRTVKGKTMPVDPLAHPRGNVTVERQPGGGVFLNGASALGVAGGPAGVPVAFRDVPPAGQLRAADPASTDVLCGCGYRLADSLLAVGCSSHGGVGCPPCSSHAGVICP